jgi:hypothetical protein
MTAPAKIRRQFVRWLMYALILVPCLYGFGGKFLELVHVLRERPEGAFAVAPIVNYLLATTGFLFLLGWAAANGMFRDVERPKTAMLENETLLDAAERRALDEASNPSSRPGRPPAAKAETGLCASFDSG